jgi:alanyl-tRNA synthetase
VTPPWLGYSAAVSASLAAGEMTDRLYYKDSYIQEFSARVVGSAIQEGGTALILDRTAFYPESGGQPCDLGSIEGLPVTDVQAAEGQVVHIVRGSGPPVDATVQARIDWGRRFDHMQQHTGQHILSQAFLQTLGAPTVSFHMSRETSTVDLAVGTVEMDQVEAAEDLANRIVFENRPVRIHFLEPEAAGSLRKAPTRAGMLRIVEVADFDRSACGGTHCRSTAEVGLIRVVGLERIRGQVRVEFVCGGRVLALLRRLGRTVGELTALFSTGVEQLAECVRGRLEEERHLRREFGALQDRLLRAEADSLAASPLLVGGFEVVRGTLAGAGPPQLNRMATLLLENASRRVVLLAGNLDRCYVLFASSGLSEPSMGRLLQETVAEFGGRGGGPADRGQGAVPDPGAAASVLERALSRLKELLESRSR